MGSKLGQASACMHACAQTHTHTHKQHVDIVNLFSLFKHECLLKIQHIYVDNPNYAVSVCVCMRMCVHIHTYKHRYRHTSLFSPAHFSFTLLPFNFLCLNTENSRSLHNKRQKIFKPAPEWPAISHKFHQSLATLLGKLWY